MNDPAQDKPVSNFLVQVSLNEDIVDAKRIDPLTESSLFTGSFIVLNLDIALSQTVLGVENLSDKDDVDFLVSLSNVIWSNNFTASDGFGIFYRDFSTITVVSSVKSIELAF